MRFRLSRCVSVHIHPGCPIQTTLPLISARLRPHQISRCEGKETVSADGNVEFLGSIIHLKTNYHCPKNMNTFRSSTRRERTLISGASLFHFLEASLWKSRILWYKINSRVAFSQHRKNKIVQNISPSKFYYFYIVIHNNEFYFVFNTGALQFYSSGVTEKRIYLSASFVLKNTACRKILTFWSGSSKC